MRYADFVLFVAVAMMTISSVSEGQIQTEGMVPESEVEARIEQAVARATEGMVHVSRVLEELQSAVKDHEQRLMHIVDVIPDGVNIQPGDASHGWDAEGNK